MSTYRLQLTPSFTFADAAAVVPYLRALGVAHLYLSPVLQARPGSTHGYDVVDPTRVSAELGGEEGLRALAATAAAHELGLIVDVVPNHMGTGAHNPFWNDVLAHGEHSRYARWFDVEWAAHPARKLVLPVLGDPLETVLARAELGLDISESGGVRLAYFEQRFPLDPASVPEQLQLVQWDPHARDAALAWVAGDEGRTRLRALLAHQHYALVHWRAAPTSINYRRFFDVNDLAALRVEDPAVFEETHALLLRLVADGVIAGVRVDHVDGLRDPLSYLERLRSEVERRCSVLGARSVSHADRSPSTEHRAPVFVEKILSPGERLRDSWPVDGTTGYEFMIDVEGVFIDPEGARRIERAYRALRRLDAREGRPTFADVAREGKLLVLRGALRADMLRLARRLAAAEERGPERATRDDVRVLADGLTQLVAALPVYRTYIDGRTELPHPDDRAVIERAVAAAQAHLQPEHHGTVARVARAFLAPLRADSPQREQRLDFIQRFQQVSGPATAKGVEDTALYRYVPLASRNEVGGEPDRPLHDAVERLHRANAARARDWPRSMLATNTHDTKRSADLRARIDVLSEVPDEWLRHVQRWRRLNRRHRTIVRGRLVPDTNTEWLLYQTLVGMWPAPRAGRRADDLPSAGWLEQARGRLEAYMLKAAKEAKLLTSWTDPDLDYEEAIRRFIGALLASGGDAPFLADMARFVAQVGRAGLWNSLSRVLLHYTAPGTPDTYQGDEGWTFSLVDPDNRRPVDFARRAAMLAELEASFPPSLDASTASERLRELLRAPEDDRLKLFVAWRILQARRIEPALFAGAYEPLAATGARATHLVAYARAAEGRSAIVVAPRLLVALGLTGATTALPAGSWSDTSLVLPGTMHGASWRSAFTGCTVHADAATLALGPLMDEFPLVLLMPSPAGH